MAKLGQEPHLSTLIGRTSDLEHSPGLIVQLHPKVEVVCAEGGVGIGSLSVTWELSSTHF